MKAKLCPLSKNRDIRRVGEVDVKLHAILVSPLDESEWSSCSSRFIPGKWLKYSLGMGLDRSRSRSECSMTKTTTNSV